MKILRYFFGTIWVLFVWLMVAVIVGLIVALIFPPHGDRVMVGVGLDWRNLPGTILGFFAARQSWRNCTSLSRQRNQNDVYSMSYDYLAWKRAPNTKTAMLADVYRTTGEGKDHPAMAPFDTAAAERGLIEIFGDVNSDPDGPFLYFIEQECTRRQRFSINVNHSQVAAVTNQIVKWALRLTS